jgi:hypothetical protein
MLHRSFRAVLIATALTSALAVPAGAAHAAPTTDHTIRVKQGRTTKVQEFRYSMSSRRTQIAAAGQSEGKVMWDKASNTFSGKGVLQDKGPGMTALIVGIGTTGEGIHLALKQLEEGKREVTWSKTVPAGVKPVRLQVAFCKFYGGKAADDCRRLEFPLK